jgi:filamentous hemagglutinin family protein
MASNRVRRLRGINASRGCDRIRSTAAWLGVLLLVCSATATLAGAPKVPLPVPCLSGNCGSFAQSFASYGTAGAVASGSTLNVTQSTGKAILNWASFNIASGYTVNFIQPSSTAEVLNEIWSANPSTIAGKLTANGQVYLYDQNGILFSKGAQVDVAGLTASTLNLPATTFENGILSNNTVGQTPPPVFVAPTSGTAGAIEVASGASLTAADGGRILLLGSAVTNQGTISTPDGQTILGAATNNVYLAASSNAALRGLLIEVDGGGTTGTVVNAGTISAARGNITLAGLVVNQEGLLSATTSVSENGSIYLVAGDTSASGPYYLANPKDPSGNPAAFGGLAPNKGGTLILAPGSVTEVLPDTTDTGTLTRAQLAGFIPSQVELAGNVVAMEGNARIHAPGGAVDVYAAADPYALITDPAVPVADEGSIYIDDASTIDVAGLADVPVAATTNLVKVTLETGDLQNDPLLRDGFLHGTTVTVDVNDPSPLFDVTPYKDNIASGIQQILTQAGSIQLAATGAVITRAGSTLDVSGGSIAYQGGLGPSTTNLIAANGKTYNISNAPNDIQYVGIANNYSYTDPTWGTSTKGSGETYYAGYTQGAAAGAITVEAPVVYLRGGMQASTVDGIYQRSASTLAGGGTLTLGCSDCTTPAGVANFGVDGGVNFSNSVTDALIGNVVVDGYPVSSVSVPTVSLLSPAQLTQSGFDTIQVYSNGTVTLPAGTNLALAPNGGLIVKSGQSIAIGGNIEAPGDSVTLQTVAGVVVVPHNITIDAGSVIDVRGAWTNDSLDVTALPGTGPIVINGGKVSVSAAGNVTLGAGAVIDVSAGAWLNDKNQLTDGTAGSIALSANFSLDPSIPATNPYIGAVYLGRGSMLQGAGFEGGEGGTLSLQSGSVTVGFAAADTPGELLLTPTFFTQGGFTQYNIIGQNGVTIGSANPVSGAAPVTLAPLAQTRVFTQYAELEPTGTSLAAFTALTTLPQSQRSAASVSFAATASDKSGSEIGDVTLAANAAITTDPGGNVTLSANGYNGDVRVFGAITAPGGNITLALDPSGPIESGSDPGFIAEQEILLGSNAVLAAPGYVESNTLNALGYVEGKVFNGGTVTINANKGFVQTDFGSLVNVRGAAGMLDVVNANGVTPTLVAGNAGTVAIEAREGIVLQGSLLGTAAAYNGASVAGAAGGSLTVALGPSFSSAGVQGASNSGLDYPTATRVLTIAGSEANGSPAVPPSNQLLSGTAVLDVATLEAGGFDRLTLTSADTIAFVGNVALHSSAALTLDAPAFTAAPGAQVSLRSAYAAVGNDANNIDYYDTGAASPNAATVLNPTTGNAILEVDAQLIDIRGISGWSGFATETFDSSGDLRVVASANAIVNPPSVDVPGSPSFEGAFLTSAALKLEAAQIYPTTATAFAIDDLPATSTTTTAAAPAIVTLVSSLSAGGAVPSTPLSAGGSLSITATEIDQGGVLRAPLGQLALTGVPILNAQGGVATAGTVNLQRGSVTSVSADGLTIPYGSTLNGTQWTYSQTPDYTSIVSAPPAKQVTLNGTDVSINAGASVSLSGGGDLYAYEFIAGEGGSVDVLNPANLPAADHPASTTVYSYAIVPTLGSLFAPIDPQYALSSPVTTGQTITLSGVPGLAAGTYALLPARYALLPGAYAVQVVEQNSGIAPGSSVAQSGGAYEVAARFGVAGTSTESSLTSTVIVASDSTVRTQSQFTDSYANAFFSSAATSSGTTAPRLPADAGELLLSATNQFALNGSIGFSTGSYTTTTSRGTTTTVQGLGGNVAITAQNIEVVDASATESPAPMGTVLLNVQELDDLTAQTLILGASATTTAAGEQLTVGSTQTIELKNTTALTGADIILAAQNSITLDPHADITATGTAGTATSGTLLLPGGGALLRVGNGPPDAIVVDPTTLPATPSGTVTIGAGATVSATGSLLLYGTDTTTLAPSAQLSAPAVGLYSSTISLGAVPSGTPGLALSSSLLGTLKNLANLTLDSSSTIDFYGAVQLGTPSSATPNLNSISLDATGLGGYGSGDKVLQAGTITLTNSNGGTAQFASAPDGSGALDLIAGATSKPTSGQIVLGAGTKTLAGFSALDLTAAGDVLGESSGGLTLLGSAPVPVTLSSPTVIGSAGSNQSIVTSGTLTLNRSATDGKLSAPAAGDGAELALTGGSVSQQGSIDLPAGAIALTATQGNVTLGSGSLTAAPGAIETYTVAAAASPAGSVTLISTTGNVTVDPNATVDVSGASLASTANTPGVSGAAGSLTIAAPLGTFTYAGSILKGGAAAGQTQGAFSLDVGSGLAGNGFDTLASTLQQSGFSGAITLRSRTDGAVTVGTTVQAASVELTVDGGTIDIGGAGVVNTSGGTALDGDGGSITLWAGDGLTVSAGAQLLANAGSAGPVGASDTALAARGGDITLGTASGAITIAGGTGQHPTLISMQGGGGADTDGTLTLRAPRTAADTGVQIAVQSPATVDVVTRDPIVVEGFKTYSATALGSTDAGCGTGGSCDVADINGVLFTDAQTFVANSAAIAAGIGLANVEVRPGVEIDSTTDLIVNPGSGVWDLGSWNAGLGVAVNVTLRAAGNLIFESSMSDGFTSNGHAPPTWDLGEPSGAASDSGSYLLTGGADLSSANPLAVIAQPTPASSLGAPPSTGNVIVAAGSAPGSPTVIRTGTGNIGIAAGGDVLLGYTVGDANGNLYDNGVLQTAESDPLNAVIYTAGVPSVLSAAQAALFTAPTLPRSGRGSAAPAPPAYPTDGGNVSISSSDDIRSAVSDQLISDWLWRRGPVTSGTNTNTNQNTTWWVMFTDFDQGIGVLGGGDLTLTAGRDLVNVAAVIPTTGRLLVAPGAVPVVADLLLTGGGYLNVQVGGNIVGGLFENDWGNTSIAAGGAVTSGGDSTFGQMTAAYNLSNPPTALSTEVYPILAVGNGIFDVSGRDGIALDGVTNSTTLPVVTANATGFESEQAAFFAYAPTANPSTLNLVSAGGDVALGKDPSASLPIAALSAAGVGYSYSPNPTDYLSTYPSTLNVAALSGNVDLGDAALSKLNPNGVVVALFPAASGNLNLLAAGTLANDGQPYSILMSQVDPTQVPSVLAPQAVDDFAGLIGVPLPLVPLHQDDLQPISIVANTGSIESGDFVFPKAGNIIAGNDILDLNFSGTNLNPSDATLIAAGGNITYSTPTVPITNALLVNNEGIVLAGPGNLDVLAGGTIDLGDANGIVTTGSLSDSRLPASGASLLVGAGFGANGANGGLRQPAAQNFVTAYLAPNASTGAPSTYASALVSYMQQLEPTAYAGATYAQALAGFKTLTSAQQLPLIADVLSDILSATGLAHTLSGASYAAGYDAINTLFPTTSGGSQLTYSGDLDMFFSQVKTEQGGNIDFLVPGGSVIVGVANPPASLSTLKETLTATGLTIPAAVDLGILVLAEGAVQGFAAEDWSVNSSRILTLEGGNIILWASNGNIDAGKGAKSVSGAPPPVIQTDANGNLFVDPSNAVTGSGIGQLLTTPGLKAGLVNLIAPKGDVNAGDAGIRVAGNLNIAAVQVIGAGNITVVGTATGVPVSEAGAFAGALSGANSLGNESKNAVDQLNQDLGNAANYEQLTESLAPEFIRVKMFCLGIECENQ